MSEAITPPVTPEATPPAPEGTTPPSGLPSDNIPADYAGFELNDDIKGRFKDGKLNGRFGSIDEVLVKLKEAEDFKAATISEQTKATNTQQQEQQQTVANTALIQEVLPTFLENGMVLTPEMETKLTEGITNPTEKELALYKFRDKARGIADRANQAYQAVGGKETYTQMREWAGENLSDAQKKIFTDDVNGSPEASQIAVEWLRDKYEAAVEGGHVPTHRIEGQPANVGIKPYADRRELYKDKDYIESPQGRRDKGAQDAYRARMRVTPDAIIFGR